MTAALPCLLLPDLRLLERALRVEGPVVRCPVGISCCTKGEEGVLQRAREKQALHLCGIPHFFGRDSLMTWS